MITLFGASGVFAIDNTGTWHTMMPPSLCGTALVDVTFPVLFHVVHTDVLVAAVTTAVNELPAAGDTFRLPTVQLRTCAPTAPLMLQFGVAVDQLSAEDQTLVRQFKP